MSTPTFGWTPHDPAINPCHSQGGPMVIDLQGFRIEATPDHHQTAGYALTGITGWDSGDTRGGALPYANSDGGYETRVDLESRIISIEGSIHALSPAAFYAAKEALGSILTHPRWDTMTVHEPLIGLSRQVTVRRVGKVQITPTNDVHGIFSLDVKAASAYREGTELRSVRVHRNGTATVVNHGLAPASVVAEIRGEALAPVALTIGNETWRYNRNIGSATTLRVIMGRRRIVRDITANEQRRMDAAGQWPTIPPGVSTVRFTAGSGTGTPRWADLTWRDTWP